LEKVEEEEEEEEEEVRAVAPPTMTLFDTAMGDPTSTKAMEAEEQQAKRAMEAEAAEAEAAAARQADELQRRAQWMESLKVQIAQAEHALTLEKNGPLAKLPTAVRSKCVRSSGLP